MLKLFPRFRQNFFISTLLIFCASSFFWLSCQCWADQPVVGRRAAQKYFAEDAKRMPAGGYGESVLMLHLGEYTDSQAYQWGPSSPILNPGQANYGVSYLMSQWHGFDASGRADFSEYSLLGNRAVKMALMPFISFPRVESGFPLYFGVGAGAGIFLQQFSNSSNISFDYEAVLGLRFMNLFGSMGLCAEYGLKNHLLILSQGQFNGTALDVGLIFNF